MSHKGKVRTSCKKYVNEILEIVFSNHLKNLVQLEFYVYAY